MAYIWLVSLYYSAPLVLTISAISWYCDRKKRQNKPAIDQLLPINERKTVLITGTNTTKGKFYTVWKIHDFPVTQILREINI